MALHIKYLALLAFCLTNAFGEYISKEIIFRKVDRKIDVASQLVKITTKLTVENIGVSQGSVPSFLYVFNKNEKENLAFIGATVSALLRILNLKLKFCY